MLPSTIRTIIQQCAGWSTRRYRPAPGMPIELCGEAAGRPETLAGFLKMGIMTVSVAPPLIPLVKDAVRELDL